MAAVAFNTLNFTRRLRAAGISAEHAEAFADALSEDAIGQLATKIDIESARRDVNSEIALLHRDLVEQGKDLRAEIRDLENRLVIKLGVMMATLAGLVFAGLKLSH